MASLIYNNWIEDCFTAGIDVDGATYKVLLVLAAYTPNKDTHEFRSAITNEVASGNGYTTGGTAATVTVSRDDTNDRVDINLGGATWSPGAGQTLTARAAVYYQVVGSSATDRLVAYIDFGSDQTASNGNLTLNASIIRFQN